MNWTDAQKKVLLDNDQDLLVSASAGSGKTTIMLEKIIQLLKKGNNIDKFLVMTFTRASASEMKEKLIKKLYDEVRLKPNNHLKKQLDLINFSNICTIDSFCLSLYKRYFADIGLQPALENMDENEGKLLFMESIDQVIEEYLHKEDEDFDILVQRFMLNRNLQPLKEAIEYISNFLDIQEDEQDFIARSLGFLQLEMKNHPAVKEYISYHIKILRRYSDECLNLIEKYKEFCLPSRYINFLNKLYDICTYIIKDADLMNFMQRIEQATFPTTPPCKKQEEYKDIADEGKALRGAITKHVSALKRELLQYYSSDEFLQGSKRDIQKLVELTITVRKVYDHKKLSKNKFDFADLSKYALQILGRKELRQEVADMFDYVFVDEYQDTNYIQERIINYIATKDNLFVVGDSKQAIYQFRHAEPKIFLERYYKYKNTGEGKIQNLNENFRSDKRILTFINEIFSEIMFYEFGGIDYKSNAELKVLKELEFPIVSKMPAVEIALYAKSSKQPCHESVYSVMHDDNSIEDEYNYPGMYVANKIKEFVGKEYIYDASLKEKRLVDYQDITILVYKRRGAENIIMSLKQHDIPYIAPGFSFARIYQIDLLIDMLRVVDNFQNDIPLSSVMQSPIFNFSPTEMLKIRKGSPQGCFWQAVLAYSGDRGIVDKIAKMCDSLREYRQMQGYCTAYELMLRIVSDGYDAYLLSLGDEIISKVNTFINSINGREYGRDIASLIEFYDKTFDNVISASSSSNAVSIMTIHNSKGLEFPIVFVANVHSGYSNHSNTKDIFIDKDFGVATKYFYEKDMTKVDTLLTKSFKQKKAQEEKEELLRLMYVAFTRAKNHLYIIGEEKRATYRYSDMLTNFAQWLDLARLKNASLQKYFAEIEIEKKPEEKSQKPQVLAKGLDWAQLKTKYNYEESTLSPLKYSVTSLSQDAFIAGEAKIAFLSQEERIFKGITLHKIIEHIDFDARTRAEVKAEIKRIEKQEGIDASTIDDNDTNSIVNLLNDPLMEYVRENKFVREKKFMLYLPLNEVKSQTSVKDKVLVQGAIDLLVLGEKNTIIDFKVSQSGVSAIKERYANQMRLYKLAVEKLLHIEVGQTIIYIVNKNITINL